MSRADVPIDAMPTWHEWRRVGVTREHYVEPGEDWPTSSAVCIYCREFRQDVAVSLLEGTFQLPPEVWPGRCNLAERGPADTDWVSMTTDPTAPAVGSIGRGIVRAIGQAMYWATIGAIWVVLLSDWRPDPWVWISMAATFGLGVGLTDATKDPTKKKRITKPKKG